MEIENTINVLIGKNNITVDHVGLQCVYEDMIADNYILLYDNVWGFVVLSVVKPHNNNVHFDTQNAIWEWDINYQACKHGFVYVSSVEEYDPEINFDDCSGMKAELTREQLQALINK